MIRLLRSHRLFPLLLVGLTGLLTGWLDQVSRWDSNRRELDPDKPENVAEHLTASRFDPQGKL
ncbi:LPS export ABC transporter periplasmic protein LptC, partial [Pseudomonas sp. MWU13-2860]